MEDIASDKRVLGPHGFDLEWYHGTAHGIIVGMTLLRSNVLRVAGFAHAFPERGVEDAELAAALGSARVVKTNQVHGARCVESGQAAGEEADAIVARAAEGPVAVGVRVADCVPVLVASEESGDVVAIHAGWRGVVAGVIGAAIERMGGGRLVAAIGPCIGPCCFEVGRDVAEAIALASNDVRVIGKGPGEKCFADLRAAVRGQLMAYIGSHGRIDDVSGCTKHEPARFHSFRRDGANSGRMLAAIAARPPMPLPRLVEPRIGD